MKINGIKTEAKIFAYDGCHKIYLIEDAEDLRNAQEFEYNILHIEDLEKHNFDDLFATLIQISEITKNVYLDDTKAV